MLTRSLLLAATLAAALCAVALSGAPAAHAKSHTVRCKPFTMIVPENDIPKKVKVNRIRKQGRASCASFRRAIRACHKHGSYGHGWRIVGYDYRRDLAIFRHKSTGTKVWAHGGAIVCEGGATAF